jgi:hypothetical protein
MKELLEHNQHITNTGANRGMVAFDPKCLAKSTIKETTENQQHILGASSNRGVVAFNKKDYKAKNTIKELAEHNQHILGASSNRGVVAFNKKEYKAKNTIKELVEHNQHILGASSNRGNVAYDPEDKPKTTIKELTEHQQHILGASSGDKGTVAYDPVLWEARGTNRQTTQNTYYTPAGHAYDAEGPRVYDAEYNAQLDDCKEIVALSGRAPTQSNHPEGPTPYLTNYRLKNKINASNEAMPDCRALNSLYRMPVNITKTKMIVPQEEIRLDENILTGLETNPFSIPGYFNDCTK